MDGDLGVLGAGPLLFPLSREKDAALVEGFQKLMTQDDQVPVWPGVPHWAFFGSVRAVLKGLGLMFRVNDGAGACHDGCRCVWRPLGSGFSGGARFRVRACPLHRVRQGFLLRMCRGLRRGG